MEITMSSKTTVKRLIVSLLELPMEAEVQICIRDKAGSCNFADVFCAYSDEYNGKKTVVLTSK